MLLGNVSKGQRLRAILNLFLRFEATASDQTEQSDSTDDAVGGRLWNRRERIAFRIIELNREHEVVVVLVRAAIQAPVFNAHEVGVDVFVTRTVELERVD